MMELNLFQYKRYLCILICPKQNEIYRPLVQFTDQNGKAEKLGLIFR